MEVARIANLSAELGWKLERENRLPTKDETYEQLSHSAALLRGVLEYTSAPRVAVHDANR